MFKSALALVALLLAGCSTNPVTGRDQFIALPAVQAHANIGFALSAGARRMAGQPCEAGCGDVDLLVQFSGQVQRIGADLAAAARGMSPERIERSDAFRISIDPDLGFATGSAADGRIALGSALARLEPADDVTAFVIAREMAHVIARHDEEDSGVRMFSSALSTFLPGYTLITKFLASTFGSGVLVRSWAGEQRREADEIAVALLDRSGRPASRVAQSLAAGLRTDILPEGDWATRYAESAVRVALLAQLPPRYAAFGD